MSRFTFLIVAVGAGVLLARLGVAEQPTPKDPKSPIPDCADGRGPTGPVELKILFPKPGEVIPIPRTAVGQPHAKGASVEVGLEVRNFETFRDPATKCGQGIALVFDNGPGAVHFDPSRSWVYPKVLPGTHTIRAFPVRPWGESIKEAGAFAMVTFSVDAKDGKNSPDPKGPLLTVSSPRGKYTKGERVLLDFLVSGCTVTARDVSGSCRVRYRIDERPEVILASADSVWLTGLPVGRHAYVVGLTRDGKLIEGPFVLYQGVFEVVDSAAAPAAPPKASGPAP
jgi:hypothetical protein